PRWHTRSRSVIIPTGVCAATTLSVPTPSCAIEFPPRVDLPSLPLFQEGRYLGHNFFLVPHPQMAAAWVADEAHARKVLGGIANPIEAAQPVTATRGGREPGPDRARCWTRRPAGATA